MLDFSAMTRPWLALVISVLLIGVAVSAAAQDASGTDEISEARALFIAGRSAFNEGRYESALDYFQRSYSLSGRSVLLFNVAQCLDRLRRDEEALAAFEKYLQEVPEAENRTEVESRIEILKSAIASRQQAPAPAIAGTEDAAAQATTQPASDAAPSQQAESSPPFDAETSTSSTSSSFPIGPVVTMAAGGVAAIVGAILMVGAQSTASDIENVQPGVKTAAQLESDRSAAEGNWIAGQVVLGVGIAAALGGVAWLMLDSGEESSSGVALHVHPTGLRLAGRF